MADLPQPTVDVTTGTMTTEGGTEIQHVEVKLGRDGKERSYAGVGSSTPGAVKDVVEKILGDHRNAEFIKRG